MRYNKRMMKYEIIKEYNEKQFRRITGIKRATFNKMIEILKKAMQKSTEGEEGTQS